MWVVGGSIYFLEMFCRSVFYQAVFFVGFVFIWFYGVYDSTVVAQYRFVDGFLVCGEFVIGGKGVGDVGREVVIFIVYVEQVVGRGGFEAGGGRGRRGYSFMFFFYLWAVCLVLDIVGG